MNKNINFNDRRVVEKQCRDFADKTDCFSASKSISINSNSLAMLASKSAFSLGVAIAVLSGCLVFTVPVHAAKILTVPSGLEQPSPLFGVKPFSTPVVLFEEFGLQDYKDPDGNPKEDSEQDNAAASHRPEH